MNAHFQTNRYLKECTTFGIGGKAHYFVDIHKIEEMQQALQFCSQHQIPYFILGKGSNCLFDDQGFDGAILANRIAFLERPTPSTFHVGAGYSFSLLGTQTAREGWTGLEFASGIPGSVGGAVYMNAGANKGQTSDCLASVDFMQEDGSMIVLNRPDLQYSYRSSSFQGMKGAIIGATFHLNPCLTARSKQLEIIHYRQKTQPYKDKSAGCIFRNPPGSVTAGALIEQAGLKGFCMGDAQVSLLHANFIINRGTATAADTCLLIEYVRDQVKEQTGVELESEVLHIPYTHSTLRRI